MKKLKFAFIFLLVATTTILFSCKEEDTFDPNAKGQLVLSFSKTENTKGIAEKPNTIEPKALLVSIKNSTGEYEYNNEEVELYQINGQYISAPISLKVGSYELIDFLVLDANNNVIYATPKKNSEKAYLVNKPLPIQYLITEDNVEKISPEVISTENLSPEDFGYNTFSFNVVETFNFHTTVFVYNLLQQNFVLSTAKALITADTDTLYNKELDAITNLITLNSNYSTYNITISKAGYTTYTKSFSKDDLLKYYSKPLTITLMEGCNYLVLQPNAEKGKDAFIENYPYEDYSNRNMGTHPEFSANAWTKNGTALVVRGLIDFDLSSIPSTATIVEAKLFLYAADNTTNGPGHSQQSGTNECIFQRVTSSWEELIVTWNTQPTTTTENQVLVPASSDDMEDYQIDVTNLIKDMRNNPSSSFGIMMKLQTESYYRRVVFASSDNTDSSKHPKLVVKYE